MSDSVPTQVRTQPVYRAYSLQGRHVPPVVRSTMISIRPRFCTHPDLAPPLVRELRQASWALVLELSLGEVTLASLPSQFCHGSDSHLSLASEISFEGTDERSGVTREDGCTYCTYREGYREAYIPTRTSLLGIQGPSSSLLLVSGLLLLSNSLNLFSEC